MYHLTETSVRKKIPEKFLRKLDLSQDLRYDVLSRSGASEGPEAPTVGEGARP
jgi:hypothetical protein